MLLDGVQIFGRVGEGGGPAAGGPGWPTGSEVGVKEGQRGPDNLTGGGGGC